MVQTNATTDQFAPGYDSQARKVVDFTDNSGGLKRNSALPNNHPYNNVRNHDALVKHIIDRMQVSRGARDALSSRLQAIDQDLAGFVKLSQDDRQRMQDNRRGKAPKPLPVNLTLADAKMDELVTYMLEVLWPMDGFFQPFTDANKQSFAKMLSEDLNRCAEDRQLYTKLAMFLYDAVKYNIAAMEIKWKKEAGFTLVNDSMQRVTKQQDVIFEGNECTVLDMYNTFFDPTKTPHTTPMEGEYIAWVRMHTKFEMNKMATAGELYGVNRFANMLVPNNTPNNYYRDHPLVRFDYLGSAGNQDWLNFANNGRYRSIGQGIELIHFYCWINPADFGLSKDNEFQIWKFCIANSKFLCYVERQNNAHNMLPVVVATPNIDGLGFQKKSPAEQLLDYNRFSSFLLNAHILSTRKSLYGVTIYDPSVVNLAQQGEDVAVRIPTQPQGYGKPIGDAVKILNDAPRTEQTLADVKQVTELMELLLPTNQQQQVADLDRATQFQAAATVQSANRRNYKMARLIDDQSLKPLRRIMVLNTLQYKAQLEVTDDTSGNLKTVPMNDFVGKKLEYAVGSGLQSMDRLTLITMLHDIINMAIQNQEVAQELDIPKLINYWTTMVGDKTDYMQFVRTQPTPSQKIASQQANTQQAATIPALAAAAQQQPGTLQ